MTTGMTATTTTLARSAVVAASVDACNPVVQRVEVVVMLGLPASPVIMRVLEMASEVLLVAWIVMVMVSMALSRRPRDSSPLL